MPKHILLIDDDPRITTVLKARLRASGYEVNVANRGPSGIAAAAADRPDIIILDVRMPEMDGIEVCRRLKADTELMSIPIIFLTGTPDDVTNDSVARTSAVGMLSKPCDFQNLINTIESTGTELHAGG